MTEESTILLYTYSDVLEANIVRDKLKAAGIDSFTENEDVIGFTPGAGIKVKIFSKDLEAAEKIISE
jgi:hypothetical protein